ncbi:hypothetical protein N431DRAFT_363208 [Stipitochalara longipes BDJ]|nr:hypothetical protein N431DRAFT_363208 [Stipitochalara longipes BDJ]
MSNQPAENLRQKKGCDACRSSKVKCDEKRPSCGACVKRNRQCSWPSPELRLSLRRKGYGPSKSREPRSCPPLVPRASNLAAEIFSTRRDLLRAQLDDTSQDDAILYEESWADMGVDGEYTMSSVPFGYAVDYFQPMDSISAGFGGFDTLSPLSDFDNYLDPAFQPLFQTLSDPNIPAANSLVLNTTEVHALDHYQKAFSIYRTTKLPRWSTHRLLLDLASENSMIMHFILAVSISDVCYRHETGSSAEAKKHFKSALRDLVELVKEDSAENYKLIMTAFLFLYLYIPKQRSLPPQTIDQLSITVRDFVKSHKLDSLCLESSSDTHSESAFTLSDRNVLARLIIWTFDEDVKCGFQGYGGHLAKYLTATRERTMAVYEVSRVVLRAFWGSTYPKDQAVDDDDNAMELELLWVLTALWQDINELSGKTLAEYAESCYDIEQRFSLIKKKYSSVFQNSAMADMPRTRVKMNADYDVVLYDALKVYYFRTTVAEAESEAPPDIRRALKNIMTIIRRTFASNGNELYDRLQWPLFLAGIETDDDFYSDWILSRLPNNRARAALKTVIQRQTYSEKSLRRLTMHQIRCLLFESQASGSSAVPIGAGQHSFWDTLEKF